MGQGLADGDNIRVGHSERDAVAETLQNAAAEGRLTLEELDERLERALKAKTFADLRPLVADLVPDGGPSHSALVPSPVHPSVQGPPPAGYTPQDQLVLDPGLGTEKREGVWTLPPFIRINQGMGTVKLNLLQARTAAPVTEIEVLGGAGTTVMVLPDGWGVNVDRLTKSWGTVSVKVPRDPAPGSPLLVVYGSMGMGTFKARPPRPSELRRLERGH